MTIVNTNPIAPTTCVNCGRAFVPEAPREKLCNNCRMIKNVKATLVKSKNKKNSI